MSLQGTFDVVALADLLRMLAAGHKSGELVIEAGGAAGRIDFYDGACSGAESTDVRGPSNDEAELHRRAIDVCFAVGRYAGGSFRFAANDGGESRHEFVVAVEPLLAELELLRAEWDEICEVVASTDLRPALIPKLSSPEITISASEWSLLARIDGYTSVADLVDTRRESLVDVCRGVAELVRRGALDLKEPATLSARDEADGNAADHHGSHDEVAYFGPRVVPVAPYGPGVDEHAGVVAAVVEVAAITDRPPEGPGVAATIEPAVVQPDAMSEAASDLDADSAGAAAESSDPRDRGAILRLFSGLREA